jgi:hypothetical protein
LGLGLELGLELGLGLGLWVRVRVMGYGLWVRVRVKPGVENHSWWCRTRTTTIYKRTMREGGG